MKDFFIEWGKDFGYEIDEIWKNENTYSISVKSTTVGMTSLKELERMGFRILSIDIPIFLKVESPTLDIWVEAEDKGE